MQIIHVYSCNPDGSVAKQYNFTYNDGRSTMTESKEYVVPYKKREKVEDIKTFVLDKLAEEPSNYGEQPDQESSESSQFTYI
jgi:hypothetical protein